MKHIETKVKIFICYEDFDKEKLVLLTGYT